MIIIFGIIIGLLLVAGLIVLLIGIGENEIWLAFVGLAIFALGFILWIEILV